MTIKVKLILFMLISISFAFAACDDENTNVVSNGGGDSGPEEIYVAVGNNGRIMTSPDGATWADETETGDHFNSLAYGNGKFVVVGNNGRIMTSSDGAVWTNETEAGDLLRSITFGSVL